MGGWLENEFLKKTPSPKYGLVFLLGTSDFGVCQKQPDYTYGCFVDGVVVVDGL